MLGASFCPLTLSRAVPSSSHFLILLFLLERLLFEFCDIVEYQIHPTEVYLAVVGEVVAQRRKLVFVDKHKHVEGPISDV